MKKLLSLVLAVCVLAAPMAASSADTEDTTDVILAAETFQIGDYILLGKYYDQPILWRCIDVDENGPLMLSDRILCRKPFDVNSVGELSGSHSRRNEKELNMIHSIQSNYWGDSNIRSWLNSSAPAGEVIWLCGVPPIHNEDANNVWRNGYDDEKGFLADGNFTQSERNVIKEVTQKSLLDERDAEVADGGYDAWGIDYTVPAQSFIENQYDEIYYEYTTDKVFLLDIKQMWNLEQKRDLLGDDFVDATLTQEAIDNDEAEQSRISNGLSPRLSIDTPCDYFLRTPWGYPYPSGPIGDLFYLSGDQVYYSSMTEGNYYFVRGAADNQGIRPAFYLNEATAQILSGSGTEEDPYVVDGKKNDSISVYVNGTELTLDVPPMLENDRTLVPMRAIFEALGAEVSWYPEDRTIVAVRGGTTVFMQVDDWYMAVNDEWIALDAPPRIVNDRTLIPLRAVAEALGAQVGWDEATQTATVELY